MNSLDLDLPSHVTLNAFDNALDASNALSTELEVIISNALEKQGQASLALSGGNIPVTMLKTLNKKSLPREKLTISLVGDRWVPPTHPDSNTAFYLQQRIAYIV